MIITDHHSNDVNDQICIKPFVSEVVPNSGEGSGYEILRARDGAELATIIFHSGPLEPHGPNGVTNEVLIAVLLDRLRRFQDTNTIGEATTACRENALAITKLEEALHWLHARTRDRQVRGVEGTDKA